MYSESFIYGLFDVAGKCEYVGQTCNPQKREYQHLFEPKSQFFGSGLMFKILRGCKARNANRIERQIGKAFKKKGLAVRSKSFGGGGKGSKFPILDYGVFYWVEETGERFESVEKVSDKYGSSPANIRQKIRRGKQVTDWITPGFKSVTVKEWPTGWDWKI